MSLHGAKKEFAPFVADILVGVGDCREVGNGKATRDSAMAYRQYSVRARITGSRRKALADCSMLQLHQSPESNKSNSGREYPKMRGFHHHTDHHIYE
jgi:hypothetical protein